MKTAGMPWLSNYVAMSYPRPDVRIGLSRQEWYISELYFLGVLARGIERFVSEQRIIGDPLNERICAAVLSRLDRFTDFTRIVESPGPLISSIKAAQTRLRGLMAKVRAI